jgi:hypothetical protein
MDKFDVTAGLAVGLSLAAVGVAGVGPGLCFTAVGAAEFIDFVQPSAFACLRRGLDFGPPPGCDDGPQPHNRMPVSVTALSTTVVPSGAMLASIFSSAITRLQTREQLRTTSYERSPASALRNSSGSLTTLAG